MAEQLVNAFAKYVGEGQKIDKHFKQLRELQRSHDQLVDNVAHLERELEKVKKRIPAAKHSERRRVETSSEKELSPVIERIATKHVKPLKKRKLVPATPEIENPKPRPVTVQKAIDADEGATKIAQTAKEAMEVLEKQNNKVLACYLACLLDWNEYHSKTYFPIMQRIQRKSLPEGTVAHGHHPDLWLLLQVKPCFELTVYRAICPYRPMCTSCSSCLARTGPIKRQLDACSAT
jgi:hypothetical protein